MLYTQSYDFSHKPVWMWELDRKGSWIAEEFLLLSCGAGEDAWESLGLQRD